MSILNLYVIRAYSILISDGVETVKPQLKGGGDSTGLPHLILSSLLKYQHYYQGKQRNRNTRLRLGYTEESVNVANDRTRFILDNAYTRIELNAVISVSCEGSNLGTSGTYY